MDNIDKLTEDSLKLFESKLAELDVLKEQLSNMIKDGFLDIVRPYFDKAGDKLESFHWKQYTPYFNDGDECEFYAYCDDLGCNGEDNYDSELLDPVIETVLTKDNIDEHLKLCEEENYSWLVDKKIGENGLMRNPKFDSNVYNVLEAISKMLNKIGSEMLKECFGNHVKITVFRDKVVVEEYYHD